MLEGPRQPPSETPAGLDDVLLFIRQRLTALRFGSVTLTIHDGKVTQLEVNEKQRIASGKLSTIGC